MVGITYRVGNPLPSGYCMAQRIWKLKTCKNDTSKWSEPAVKLSIYFPPLSNEIIDKHLCVGCHWFHSKAIMVFGWNVVALWNSSKRNKPENLISIKFSGILWFPRWFGAKNPESGFIGKGENNHQNRIQVSTEKPTRLIENSSFLRGQKVTKLAQIFALNYVVVIFISNYYLAVSCQTYQYIKLWSLKMITYLCVVLHFNDIKQESLFMVCKYWLITQQNARWQQ